jgi:hypothetical protein
MIIERIERPNAQPIIQPSRSKLERQAANDARPRPSGYVCGACGEQHCECHPESASAIPWTGWGRHLAGGLREPVRVGCRRHGLAGVRRQGDDMTSRETMDFAIVTVVVVAAVLALVGVVCGALT